MFKNPNHLGLGAITRMVGLSKSNLVKAAKMGVGATAAITLSDLLQSRVLVKDGRPLIPMGWAPAVTAVFGFVGGNIVSAQVDDSVGEGMVAGGVGVAVSALIARFMSPAVSVSEKAGAMTEDAGGAPQATAGFGFGRAFAPSLGAMAGLSGGGRGPQVYGVGTPDMSAMGMFAGANVAIEEKGLLSGANVAIEEPDIAGIF